MKFLLFPAGTLLLVPAFAIIGAAKNQRDWLGAIVGGCIGLFIVVLALGWMPAKIVDTLSPPESK